MIESIFKSYNVSNVTENHQGPRTRDSNTPFTYTPGNGTLPRLRRQPDLSQETNQFHDETTTGRSLI